MLHLAGLAAHLGQDMFPVDERWFYVMGDHDRRHGGSGRGQVEKGHDVPHQGARNAVGSTQYALKQEHHRAANHLPGTVLGS